MTKYIATYEFELEDGDLPSAAVADFLMLADKDNADWTVWELSSPKLIDVKPVV